MYCADSRCAGSGTTTSAPRAVDGVELPAAGIWKIDPGHAESAPRHGTSC
ncbi:hypothetical protein [Streptomyces sp. SCL15-4]|nr:hypothetical protein [Streptomyces sp. SCL15-4]